MEIAKLKLCLEGLSGMGSNRATTLEEEKVDLCIKFRHKPDSLTESALPTADNDNNVSSSLTLSALPKFKLDAVDLLKPNCVITLPSINPRYEKEKEEEDETFENIFLGCLRIENLDLEDLRGCFMLNSMAYFTSHLSGTRVRVSLTSLSLSRLRISDSWLENLIRGLPFLERLTLDCCDGLVNPKIRSQTLKYFNFYYKNCWELYDHDNHGPETDAELDTPNLLYFNYEGPVLHSFLIINSPNLLEANVNIDSADCPEWYYYLLSFLAYLNCSTTTTLNLYLPSNKDLIIPERKKIVCSNAPMTDLKHLKVKTNCDAYKKQLSEWEASLLWLAPSAVTREIEYII